MEALNQKERKFAEENHGLIYSFLNYYRLPEAEYYDICAIAYLRAVKDWHSKPDIGGGEQGAGRRSLRPPEGGRAAGSHKGIFKGRAFQIGGKIFVYGKRLFLRLRRFGAGLAAGRL